MARLPDPVTSRSLLEVVLGFVGVLLVVPLAFRVIGGIFRLGLVRRLIGEAVFVGLTALLTKEGVLDRLFGQPGETGDGLLKPRVDE
jgi:hypothetical protein